jgi:hypothetical protein
MIGWFILFIIIVIAFWFSRAGECYECGKRDPSVFSTFKTRALCNKCWVSGQDLP